MLPVRLRATATRVIVELAQSCRRGRTSTNVRRVDVGGGGIGAAVVWYGENVDSSCQKHEAVLRIAEPKKKRNGEEG